MNLDKIVLFALNYMYKDTVHYTDRDNTIKWDIWYWKSQIDVLKTTFENCDEVSVDYHRILKLETQLAEEIRNQIAMEGVCVAPFVQQNRFVFFANDNSDFNEDTLDGKRTTHATATVVYQRRR